MSQDCGLHKYLSVFFSPLKWDRMARWAAVEYSPPPTVEGRGAWSWMSPFLRSVRLWLTSITWGQALLQSAQTYFKMAFSSSPSWSLRGFFCNIYCENLVGLVEVKLTVLWGPPWLHPPGVLTLRVVPAETPAIFSYSSGFPILALLPVTVPLARLCSGKPRHPVFPCWSLQFWGQWFPNPRRVVDVYLFLGQSDDFQAPYMRSLTPEVLCCLLKTKWMRKSR